MIGYVSRKQPIIALYFEFYYFVFYISVLSMMQSDHEVIKLFFMLNSTVNEFLTAHKTKIQTAEDVSCFKSLRCCIYHANKC